MFQSKLRPPKRLIRTKRTNIWARPWENVTYAVCEQQRRRSDCASALSDQHLCCSLLRQYDISRFYSPNFKNLASFCGCAGQFVSGLVGDSRRHIFSCRGSYGILQVTDNCPTCTSCRERMTAETISQPIFQESRSRSFLLIHRGWLLVLGMKLPITILYFFLIAEIFLLSRHDCYMQFAIDSCHEKTCPQGFATR